MSTPESRAGWYDAAGRITSVRDTPSGGECTTRLFGYDSDSNRTGLTTVQHFSDGTCDTNAADGTTQTYAYDAADRLTDTAATYDPLGDTTALPANDAGGATLTSTFYADQTLHTLNQSGQTVAHQLDPAGRISQTTTSGTSSASETSHYSDSSDSPTWTIDGNGVWTRNITGIDGDLVAIEQSGQQPVLQLTNLHGDVIAQVPSDPAATAPTATDDTTEFGVPRSATPARYSWLGAGRRPTELGSGVIAMGARAYVPQLGRFLQTDPVPGGSANAYAYTFGDPVNQSDPSGAYTPSTPDWLIGLASQTAVEAAQAYAAAQAAAAAAAAAAVRMDGANSGRAVPRSIFGDIGEVVAGAAGVVVGTAATGACILGSEGEMAPECVKAGGAVIVGGTVLVLHGVDKILHHKKSKHKKR